MTSKASRLAAFMATANTQALATAPSTEQIANTFLSKSDPTITGTLAANAVAIAGNLTITGTTTTSNTIVWNANSVGAPTAITRSIGTKLVLSPTVAVDKADYAIGIETDNMWSSVSSTAQGFKWYANTFTVMTANTYGVTLPNTLRVGNSSVYSQFTQVSTYLQVNATSVGMSIAGNGNVGIGTSVPGSKLVVNGAMTAVDVTVSGNLTVSGTTTYINTTNLNVGDNIVSLNADLGASAPSENAGISVNRGTSPNVAILWDESIDKWTLTNDGTTYANIVVGAVSGGGSLPTTISAQNTTGVANASGGNSFAVGALSNASGTSTIAIGVGAVAAGQYTIALGYTANTNAANSIAVGVGATALLTNSVAIGANSRTYGYDTVAMGAGSFANGNYSISIGSMSRANNYGQAIGQGAGARDQGIAVGTYANAYGGRAIAIGYGALAYGQYSVALGAGASTYSDYEIKMGTSTHAVSVPGTLIPTFIYANNAFGSSGQVLKSNSTGSGVYWDDAGGFSNGSNISVGTLTITGALSGNGSSGSPGQMLYSSGNGIYWGDAPAGGSGGGSTMVDYSPGSNTYVSGAGSTYITASGPYIMRIRAGQTATTSFLAAVNALTSGTTINVIDSSYGPVTVTVAGPLGGAYGSTLAADQWVQFEIAPISGPPSWDNIVSISLLTPSSEGGGGSSAPAANAFFISSMRQGEQFAYMDVTTPSGIGSNTGILLQSRGAGFGSGRYVSDVSSRPTNTPLTDLTYQVLNWSNQNHSNVIYQRGAGGSSSSDTTIRVAYDGQYYFDYAAASMWVTDSSSDGQQCFFYQDQIATHMQTSYAISPRPQQSGYMYSQQGWVYGQIYGQPNTMQSWMASVQIVQPLQGHIWYDTTNSTIWFRMPWGSNPTVIQGATPTGYDYMFVSLYYFGA